MTAATAAASRILAAELRREAKRAELAAWAVPPSARPAGYVDAGAHLATDGTDQTAALQALLDLSPAAVVIPAGTYRIDGPVVAGAPLALIGEGLPILDCSHATGNVLTLNPAGTFADQVAGFSITGIAITGPGMESSPAMVFARGLAGFRADYCIFRNIGYAALILDQCADSVVEHCIFTDVYKEGLGYGIAVLSDCDRTTIRENFFTGKGRHNVTIGEYTPQTPDHWCREVVVEENYCGCTDLVSTAIDSHPSMAGPYLIRNNVVTGITSTSFAVALRSDISPSVIEDNAFLDCAYGVYLGNRSYTDEAPPEKVDTIQRNVMTTTGPHIQIDLGNPRIVDNVMICSRDVQAISYPGAWTPTIYEVLQNLYGGPTDWLSTGPVPATAANIYVTGDDVAAALVSLRRAVTFAVSPAAPYARQAVQFLDTSEGAPASWLWDFGDGAASDLQNPVHAYAAPGPYVVTLTADGLATGAGTVTIRGAVVYGGVELSHTDLAPLDHDPVANATETKHGRVRLQGSPVSRRTWTINALADDHAEIDALAALKGQRLTLNLNGVEYPGVMIRPPLLETQLAPGAWAYQVGFIQET